MSHHSTAPTPTAYECVIGLEVHVQLATGHKLFCPCAYRFGAEPNTLVCPICLAYPGTMPVIDPRAVDLAMRLCLALNARLQPRSVFVRKSYFYPDQPKGFQITQHDAPLALGGYLPLTLHATSVRLLRLHLEEDAGKLVHCTDPESGEANSHVDFNRAGVALLEIVSAPELRSPAEARDFVGSMRQVLRFTRTSDGNMEEGSLRCDANISLRRCGTQVLGSRIEIKNLNSTRHVERALAFEITRQRELLESGKPVPSETRGFDAGRGRTYRLRGKEDTLDYRYHDEPDLPPLLIDEAAQRRQAERVGIRPWEWRQRLIEQGRDIDEARTLTTTPAIVGYYQLAMDLRPDLAAQLSNWVRTDLLKECRRRRIDDPSKLLPAERLVDLVDTVDRGLLSSSAGQQVLHEMWQDPASAVDIAQRLNVLQEKDPIRLQEWVRQVLESHPQQVETYRRGKHALLGFFIGKVMAQSGGRAEPRETEALLRRRLDPGADAQPTPETTT